MTGVQTCALPISTNDPVTILLNIRYDNAIQTPQGTGIGTNVGRVVATAAQQNAITG